MPDDFDPLFGSPTGAAAAETALANNAGGAAAAAHTATVTTQPQAEPQAREPEDMFAQVMAQRDAGGAIPVVVVAEPLRDATAVPNAVAGGGSQIARPSTGTSGQPAVEVVRMALFAPGMKVQYQGRDCTVSHTVISCGELLVQLREIPQPVRHDQLIAPQTQLSLARTR